MGEGMKQIPFCLRTHRQWVEEICDRVDSTPFLREPFPHILIHDFLPEVAYEKLHCYFPSMENFEAFAYDKHHTETGESNRKRFQTNNDSLERLDGEAKVFWYTLRSVLGSNELKRCVFSKLSPGLRIRYGCPHEEVSQLKGFALPEVFHETDGYSIKPHPDTRKKVVTMQIALPTDNSQVDLGTEFYQRAIRPAAWLREPRGFDVVKRMPFLPNTAFAFVVLNTIGLKSWHGRTSISGDSLAGQVSKPRKSILNIWYDRVENACTDIFEDNQRLEMMAKRSELKIA